MNNEQTRADFEQLILAHGGSVDRVEPGEYRNAPTESTWFGYQAATLKANQWRPIANAPKDGSLFLGATDKGAVQIIKRNKHLHIWVTDDGKKSFRTMTYWLPLPPTGTEQKQS